MNFNLPRLLCAAALAASMTLSLFAQIEGSAPDAKAPPATPPPAESVTAPVEKPPVPAAPPPPSAGETTPEASDASAPARAPDAPSSAAAEENDAGDRPLRRLDVPANSADASEVTETVAESAPAEPAARRTRDRDNYGAPRVMIGQEVRLPKGETAETLVAIGNQVIAEGDVRDAVVAIGGDVHVTGSVGGEVVAVLGNVFIDAEVGRVNAVMGSVTLGPNAVVRGDIVTVGGAVHRDPKSIVHGGMPQVGLPAFNAEWLKSYIQNCIFKVRPLAFAPHLGWAWAIALGFFALYLMLAAFFGPAVLKTRHTFEAHPGGTFLAAILTILLTPVLIVLLSITVVGVAVVPFLAVGLFLAKLFGKVVILSWIGSRVTRLFGKETLAHPIFGVLIGGLIVLGLYTVPVVGFLTYKLITVLGLGVAVYTLILVSKREKSAPGALAGVGAGLPTSMPPAAGSGFTSGAGATTYETKASASGEVDPLGASAGVGAATAVPPAFATIPPTTVPPRSQSAPSGIPVAANTLPRAGFWVRMGALAIDVVLVAVVLGFVDSMFRFFHVGPPGLMVVLAAYGALFWKLRGTTIGGIICGLQVVRLDGRELDWATALVRALGCFLSLIVAGLGFIWVAIDPDKQSWHDKIAGTAVVLNRRPPPLV